MRPLLRHPLLPAVRPHGGKTSAHRRSRDLLAVVLCCALLLAACGSARTGQDTAAPTEEILASASSAAADAAAEESPGLSGAQSAAAPQAAIAPCWLPLAERLKADGLSGPRVDALLATLAPTPTQSPMGRKIRELYRRRFLPRPSTAKPAPR